MPQPFHEKLGRPFEQAGRIRRLLRDSLRGEYPVRLAMTPQTFACLMGVPARDFLNNEFSILIEGSAQDEVSVMKADNSEIAFEAFRHMKLSPHKDVSRSYYTTLYSSLYALLQAGRKGKADEMIRGVAEIHVGILEEDIPGLENLGDFILGNGTVPQGDEETLHALMRQIWQKYIPDEYKGAGGPFYGFNPDNVFT